MINLQFVKECCNGDYTKIKNYQQAADDKAQCWVLHHLNEIDPEHDRLYSAEELDEMGMYYNRPPEEFIFLTKGDHSKLHGCSNKNYSSIKKACFQRHQKIVGAKYWFMTPDGQTVQLTKDEARIHPDYIDLDWKVA